MGLLRKRPFRCYEDETDEHGPWATGGTGAGSDGGLR